MEFITGVEEGPGVSKKVWFLSSGFNMKYGIMSMNNAVVSVGSGYLIFFDTSL
jgi:prefoldin subunit 5